MSINEYWQKTLAYFGMADVGHDEYDEYDEYDDHDRETNASVRDEEHRDDRGSRDRGSRRAHSGRSEDFDDIYSDPGVPSPSRHMR